MTWTVTEDGNVIQVRASIDVETQQDELHAFIEALEKRLEPIKIVLKKENPDV